MRLAHGLQRDIFYVILEDRYLCGFQKTMMIRNLLDRQALGVILSINQPSCSQEYHWKEDGFM